MSREKMREILEKLAIDAEDNNPVDLSYREHLVNQALSQLLALKPKVDEEKLKELLGNVVVFSYEEMESDGDYEGAGVHPIDVPVPLKDFLKEYPDFLTHLAHILAQNIEKVIRYE